MNNPENSQIRRYEDSYNITRNNKKTHSGHAIRFSKKLQMYWSINVFKSKLSFFVTVINLEDRHFFLNFRVACMMWEFFLRTTSLFFLRECMQWSYKLLGRMPPSRGLTLLSHTFLSVMDADFESFDRRFRRARPRSSQLPTSGG